MLFKTDSLILLCKKNMFERLVKRDFLPEYTSLICILVFICNGKVASYFQANEFILISNKKLISNNATAFLCFLL